MEGDGREAPRLAVEACCKGIELADVRVLQNRPGIRQWDPGIQQDLSEDAVAGPVLVGEHVELDSAGCVLVRCELQGRSGDDEAGSAVREDDVRDLGFGADIERLLGVVV